MSCAIVRRMRAPNPLVDLPYLRQWNTIALATALFAFRFVLLATALVIPQSLSFRGLDAAQFGPAVLWTAVAEMFLAVFAAHLLNKGLDSRLLMALGFATIGAVCLVNAEFTSAWAAENYFRTELLMAVGQSFAFVGLVSHSSCRPFSPAASIPVPCADVLGIPPPRAYLRGADRDNGDGPLHREQEKVHSYLVGLMSSRATGSRSTQWTPDRRLAAQSNGGAAAPAARSDWSPAAFASKPTCSPSSTRFTSWPGCRSRR